MENPFALLGLPQRFELNKKALEARYRELQKLWHPDRHGRAPAKERMAMLQRATDLNQAYRLLSDDGARAECLLRLYGLDLGAEGRAADPRAVLGPTFLMEMMELREELQAAHKSGNRSRVRDLDAQVRLRMLQESEALALAFRRIETPQEENFNVDDTLRELAQNLLARRYYQRFRDEVESYDEAHIGMGNS